MRFMAIVLILVAVVEMGLAGMYYGKADDHALELDVAANRFNELQELFVNELATPEDELEMAEMDIAYDNHGRELEHYKRLNKTMGLAACMTALVGLGLLGYDMRKRRQAADQGEGASA